MEEVIRKPTIRVEKQITYINHCRLGHEKHV